MAASYRSLATNSRYLRGIAFDSSESSLHDADRVAAEAMAAVEIEAGLGTTFPAAPAAPPLIALLADLIGSAFIYEWLALQNNLGEKNEGLNKPTFLRKKADQILADLREHKIGVMAADGTYPFALYPQPSVLPSVGVGAAKNIAIDAGLAWGEMAQGRITDAERQALDTQRERMAFDLEAAFAGAYGV